MWHSSKDLITGCFCLSSAKMSGARSLAFARVSAPDFATHLLVSHAAVFVSARNVTQHSSPKAKRQGVGGGEGGECCWPEKNDCVWAKTSNLRACRTNIKLPWSKADSSPVISAIQPFPSGARDVIGRGKTPCSWRARYAKTTGDGSGSQVKRRT